MFILILILNVSLIHYLIGLDPILLNSHLLANGAQQLLTIQPQLLALQQQQQLQQEPSQLRHHLQHDAQSQSQPDAQPFYRKAQSSSSQIESQDSPPLPSRKDTVPLHNFKMRNRESKNRIPRLSRSLNGHGGEMMMHHHMQHQPTTSSHSPSLSSITR